MLDAINPDTLSGRVGFRCASPDYLPLVGPVPARDAFLQDFAKLRRNARQTIDKKGKYMPGLYLSTGHGSRGLTSTPLAAELLASAACGEPPPLDRALCRALAPARFLIRHLSRNRA
jgi:tRNA 5-methylaminomethyl-2-thiouridine biosynthesis bifunctional protein